MLRLLRALTQLLQIWWTTDRIRVARSEGKLFRIDVGDRLLIEGKIFIVTSRHESGSSLARVDYELEEVQADGDDLWGLNFTMQSDSAWLCQNRDCWEVNCEQVSILARNTDPRAYSRAAGV